MTKTGMTMKPHNFKNQVNAVGGLSVAIVAGFFAYELGRSRDAPPCGLRFPSVTEMSLVKQGGAALSPGELQARAGIGETGMIEKASIVRVDGGPSPYALSVAVGGQVATDTGASFFWAPAGMTKATAACLSYDVFVPAKFDFARGGRLPGLFGGIFSGNLSTSQNAIGMHLTWDERGQIGLGGISASGNGGAAASAMRLHYQSELEMPRGRWVRFEQEVAMNTPGAENGLLRLWIDGQLKLQDTAVVWRPDESLALTGAWADIGYQSFGGIERTAKSQSGINVSPLRLSWQ